MGDIMDSHLNGFSDSGGDFNYGGEGNALPSYDQYQDLVNGFRFDDPTTDLSFMDTEFIPSEPSPSPSASVEGGDSPSDDGEFGDDVLKYISHILMEEDMEDKPCMFHDALALQAAEKSLYEALGEKYSPPMDQPAPFLNQVQSPGDSRCSSDYGSNSSACFTPIANSGDNGSFGDFREQKPSILYSPLPDNFVFQSPPLLNQYSAAAEANSLTGNGNGHIGPFSTEFSLPNLFSSHESVLQFNRGLEEASKFLPKANQLTIDLENRTFSTELREKAFKTVVKVEDDESDHSPDGFNGKKNHKRGDSDLEEERSNKQSAVFVDESELAEMFDRVLLCNIYCKGGKEVPRSCAVGEASQNGTIKYVLGNGETKYVLDNGATKSLHQEARSNNGNVHGKKQDSKKEVVDLRTLLIQCAQAISADNLRTTDELLKRIRQHSSPFGDGSQRLAHCFADALEARLSGTGTQIYTALASKPTSAADMLKAYQVYISACPFMKIACIFANNNLLNLAEKASTIHIIDFGILYGFQWPALIARLGKRPGGPPKLRITGIELPQRGFRPAAGVLETGRRLARYCELFKVPFEYNAIAQKWETIKLGDLKISNNEVTAVNCLFRFKNLLDETVVVNSPRTAVLKLIRSIKPDMFVQAIVNGSYNAPFFVTRFREALFNYSAMFDMLAANLPCEDQMRLMYEKEFYRREVINVVACEGSERVERPETYKQWQVRNTRSGFRQLPLDPMIMKKLRGKVKAAYHNDFMVDEDGHWMLQGWKGRILYASSCWVPA